MRERSVPAQPAEPPASPLGTGRHAWIRGHNLRNVPLGKRQREWISGVKNPPAPKRGRGVRCLTYVWGWLLASFLRCGQQRIRPYRKDVGAVQHEVARSGGAGGAVGGRRRERGGAQ